MSTLILIGCGKKKAPGPRRAVDLYQGPLYRKRLLLAKKMGGPHWILSAKFGIVEPTRVLRPYDRTLGSMSVVEREAWSSEVASQILARTTPGDTLVVLAGAEYFRGWRKYVESEGRAVSVPVIGSLGRQMSELKRRVG